MMKLLKRVRISKSGASAAEYALILAVIGGGIVVAAVALKTSISGSMNKTANLITTNTPT
jgi:pilus assembly protein Flp/PilA